jgi:hypothetical protein
MLPRGRVDYSFLAAAIIPVTQLMLPAHQAAERR